jgi:hypothetical protein
VPKCNFSGREFVGLKVCAVRVRDFLFSSRNCALCFDYEENLCQCHPNVAPASPSSMRGVTKKCKISLLALSVGSVGDSSFPLLCGTL